MVQSALVGDSIHQGRLCGVIRRPADAARSRIAVQRRVSGTVAASRSRRQRSAASRLIRRRLPSKIDVGPMPAAQYLLNAALLIRCSQRNSSIVKASGCSS